MGDISSVQSQYNRFLGDEAKSLASSIGIGAAQASLSYNYPTEFEYYMMALELVDYLGKTVDYFIFPVNPNSYRKTTASATNVQSTMNGVSIVGNSSFIPSEITMQGNFGRKFKLLIGGVSDNLDFSVAQYSTANGAFTESDISSNGGKFRKNIMSSRVKTGYGAMRILEGICAKSRASIDGKPMQLYMYNPAFGDNYLVKVMHFSPSMNSGKNFIHEYDLSLKAVAPLEAVIGSDATRKSLKGAMAKSVVQNGANQVLNSIEAFSGVIEKLVLQ